MIVLLGLWACADPCQRACADLGDALATCGWADSAWTDRRDFEGWCAAWALEAPLAVAGDAGGWCAEVTAEARDGDCAALASGEWSAWP